MAMDRGGTFTYLNSDHLGSTVMETVNGAMTTDQKYYAYGKQRDSGTVLTDHRFTGQKEDASGLQYFAARVRPSLLETVLRRGQSSERKVKLITDSTSGWNSHP